MKILEYIGEKDGVHTFMTENWEGRKAKTIIGAASREEAEQNILSRPEPDYVQRAKDAKIREVKRKANELINRNYPDYKQRNYALGLNVGKYSDASEKQKMKSYLESVITESERIESEINAKRKVSTVEEYVIDFQV